MSMDILTGAGGRVSSPTKGTAAQSGKIDTADQEMSDPAKLFGALLENSDSKETDRSEQNDEGEVEDGDIASPDRSHQPQAYFISQPLFSLTKDFSARADKDTALQAVGDSKTNALLEMHSGSEGESRGTAIADVANANLQEKAVASGMNSLAADFGKKSATAATAQNKTDAKLGSESAPDRTQVNGALNDASPIEGMPAEHTDTTDNSSVAASFADGGNVSERMGVQQQPQVLRAPVPLEVKSAPTSPQAAVRIDDVQVISERSFGAVKTLQIRLDPVDLGQVTARIRVVADNIEVHLIADKPHAAEALAADRSMIEKALKVAGVTDDSKITVSVAERGTVNVQQSASSQNATQQQSNQSQGQQGQQGFGMQSGTDGRNGSQGGSQAQFLGGESRQNGHSAQQERATYDARGGSGEAANEAGLVTNGRRNGLVV